MADRIEALEALAREFVGGDSREFNLFFVTDNGVVVTVSQDFRSAYEQWKRLSARYPMQECALEDKTGVLASVEPEEEGSTVLVILDDSASAL
jgi:hypothetical protein